MSGKSLIDSSFNVYSDPSNSVPSSLFEDENKYR